MYNFFLFVWLRHFLIRQSNITIVTSHRSPCSYKYTTFYAFYVDCLLKWQFFLVGNIEYLNNTYIKYQMMISYVISYKLQAPPPPSPIHSLLKMGETSIFCKYHLDIYFSVCSVLSLYYQCMAVNGYNHIITAL